MGQMVCHSPDRVDLSNHEHWEAIGLSAKAIFAWLARFSLRALEYGFGMYVGAAVGWVAGYFTGGVYTDIFQPVYFADFSNMEEIMRWERMPYTFATVGLCVGAIAGALLVFIAPGETREPLSDDPVAIRLNGQQA